MPKLRELIELYGQAMAEGKSKAAAKQLAAINKELDDKALDLFEKSWEELPAMLYRMGLGDSPEIMKKLVELIWLESRRNLVLGRDFKFELTPQFWASLREKHASKSRSARTATAKKAGALTKQLRGRSTPARKQ